MWSKIILLRILRSRSATIGLVIVSLFLITTIFASVIAPRPAAQQTLKDSLTPPGRNGYPLGSDVFGRCVLSRIIFGTRVSLKIAILGTIISASIGVPLGAIAGFFGGGIDYAIEGLIDLSWAFPSILLALALMFILGPGLQSVMIAVGLVYWGGYARITRGQFLVLREEDYVQAALAVGASRSRIIIRHLLPNSWAPLIVQVSLGMARIILIEAALSFLGVGAQPPTPSWGSMLSNGRMYLLTAPWLTLFPGIAIMLVVLGFNLLGDGLRDALDPRLSRSR